MLFLNLTAMAVTVPVILWWVIGAAIAAGVLLWCVIAAAGAAPVMTLHKAHLQPLPDARARKILFRVLSDTPHLDGDWLNAQGFAPIGVFKAEGLMGSPKVIAWERRGEATWFCGYLLPDGSCQLDLVSKMEESVLTTGTTKDGNLFPTKHGKYVQTFDTDSVSDLWEHHQQATEFLSTTSGLQVDRKAPEFSECFADSLREEGEHIRSILLWPAWIPWWYFTRRSSRHNRSVEQLYG